ncbi:hypothetical protein [Clostridium botulinum]|nr:hypothetical protein [Clostridium botulinum]
MKKHFKIIKECIGSNDGLCESCYGTGYMEDGWDCQEWYAYYTNFNVFK